jgi:hypothetical protein
MMLIMLVGMMTHHGPVAVRVNMFLGDMQPHAYGNQGCGS